MEQRVKDLRANPENPREVAVDKLEMLEVTLREFGDLGGIVFNRRTGHLVGGHQRTSRLPENAEIKLVKRLDKPSRTGTTAYGYVFWKGERFSYREVSWPEAKEKAANIAANKGVGKFDDEKLSKWFKELEADGFDLDLTLFDIDERENYMADVVPAAPKESNDNVFPGKAPVRTSPGDIFVLGNHKLLCGDATDPDQVKRLMKSERADLTFTSPPYNGATQLWYGKHKGKLYLDNDTDDKTSEEYLDFNRAVFGIFKRFLKDDANIFYNVNYNQKSRSEFLRIAVNAEDDGFNLYETIVWRKSGIPVTGPDTMTRNFEFIFLFNRGETYRTNKKTANGPKAVGDLAYSCNVWEISNSGIQTADHAACFPVALPEKALIETSQPGDLVFEPFAGSGTTLIAAEKTERRCFSVELEPRYCDNILARWEAFTGEKAKRLKK